MGFSLFLSIFNIYLSDSFRYLCLNELYSAACIYKVCSEVIQPCNMKNRDIYLRRYKKHCTWDCDTSVPFKVGTLGSHTVLPNTVSCPVVFS